GRVHGHARATQAPGVGDAPGEDARLLARGGVLADVARVAQLTRVVAPERADEDAGAAVEQALDGAAGVLERLDGQLEQQALLGVELGRLARRDGEGGRVEAVDLLEEAAAARGHRAWVRALRVVEGVGVPALRRHLADRLAALDEQAPQRPRVISA